MSDLTTILKVIKHKASVQEIKDEAFPEQNAFVMDPSRYLIARCTRRAGKSTGLGIRFFRTLQRHNGCLCPYIALTRESAKNIMWEALQELDERFKIGAKFTASNLSVSLKNGSRLQLFGADMKNFIRRLKGIKTPGAAIDELQDFPAHIESLVDDVLGPAILDYEDGWIALTGTPGPIPSGYFYKISEKGEGGFSRHMWSLFQNPYVPGAKAFVDDLKKRKGWTDANPTLRREYYNEWILDLDILVFKYNEAINHYETLPKPINEWRIVIGVDIGFHDADAIAVLGWHEKLKAVYLIEETLKAQQGITELADQIEALITKYNPEKIVMDTGGLGKKIAEELRKRRQLPILAADKARKVENIEILNDAMRTGTFFAKRSSVFASDSKQVKWDYDKSTPDKLVISDSFHSDICDAVSYSFREALHWLYEAEKKPVIPKTPEWYKAQEDEAIEKLEQGLSDQKSEDHFNQDPWDGL